VKCTEYASFWPSIVTSWWLLVKWRPFQSTSGRWGDVTSFSLAWRPNPANYSLVGSEMYSIRKFLGFYSHFLVTSVKWRHFRVTYDHLKTHDVISCHVTASSIELQPCRKRNVHYTPVFDLLQPLPGDFRSNDVTSGSLPVTWDHVTSFPVTWLPTPATYSLVGSEMYSIREFSAFYSHFQVTSGQMTSLQSHFRPHTVT